MKQVLLLVMMLPFTRLQAQSPEEPAVKACINRLFDAMRSGDSVALAACFSPSAVMQTILTRKDGSTEVRTESVQAFIHSVGQPHKEPYEERIEYGSVLVDGHLAVAWTPYRFYLGTKFSHCGVNSFQLVKLKTGWKVQYIIDTRRKEGCP
ncbi:MAG: nuclear transport factor 2 family protein [Flavihumibacter sp.]